VVTLSDPARSTSYPSLTAADISTRKPTVTPDDPVFRALRRMAMIDVGRLPMGRIRGPQQARRAHPPLGSRRRVSPGLTRSLARNQQQASRLRDLASIRFLELTVAEDATAAGRSVRDVNWPPRTIRLRVGRVDAHCSESWESKSGDQRIGEEVATDIGLASER
jgi:CIC family chloride channel protein